MLGYDLRTALAGRNVSAPARSELDLTDSTAVSEAVAAHDVVINAAAYTAVDDAETDEAAAFAVNAIGARNLARASAMNGVRMVQVSTDYVFDGRAVTPYAESAPRGAVSAYGRTKAAGEEFVLQELPESSYIVRTAWLYGANGKNFASTMLELAAVRETWSVVDDQRGQPTWTADLADAVVQLLDAGAPAGIYHGTSSGETTWFGFARAVLENMGLDPERIVATDSSAFVRPAPRPAYSVLGHDAWRTAGLNPIRDWRAALDAATEHGIFGRATVG
ncbi:NAD(P)-dependent oxidoreductase [Agromyces aureus]|uniref:dTDP-4-dehydrorhamnose reductase n=2 Tax=Agromyces aureus TaxID=453304 RepID=A0A191WL51_9MICO|nr:NAD(P)-dependent oxidoreductase [Agromyces aureus]